MQQQTISQLKQKSKISKTSIQSRRTKRTKTVQVNKTDLFSNDSANNNMNINNNFFVQQNLKQKKITLIYFFITFFARNTLVSSMLNSHKSRQSSLFSFFQINQSFTPPSKYVQWTRRNASAIFRQNNKKIQILRQKKCDFDEFWNVCQFHNYQSKRNARNAKKNSIKMHMFDIFKRINTILKTKIKWNLRNKKQICCRIIFFKFVLCVMK